MNLTREQPVEAMLADLYHALLYPRGWSLARIGDGEVNLLRVNAQAALDWSYYGENFCDASALRFLQEHVVAAFREADWIGLFSHGGPDLDVQQVFELWGIPEPRQQCYAWVNRHLPMYRDFMEILKGEPMLLLGKPMQEWAEKCLLPGVQEAKVTVYTAVTEPSTQGMFYALCEAVRAFPGRLVLASLGVWAKPICMMAKRLGKIGIDFGHAPTDQLSNQQLLNIGCCERGRRGYLQHWPHAKTRIPCLFPLEANS